MFFHIYSWMFLCPFKENDSDIFTFLFPKINLFSIFLLNNRTFSKIYDIVLFDYFAKKNNDGPIFTHNVWFLTDFLV